MLQGGWRALGQAADGDHSMLSGKPLGGYRCMACDRPLTSLDARPGPYLPSGQLPVSLASGAELAAGAGVALGKVRWSSGDGAGHAHDGWVMGIIHKTSCVNCLCLFNLIVLKDSCQQPVRLSSGAELPARAGAVLGKVGRGGPGRWYFTVRECTVHCTLHCTYHWMHKFCQDAACGWAVGLVCKLN